MNISKYYAMKKENFGVKSKTLKDENTASQYVPFIWELGCLNLFTTMGMGRVRTNTPERAQNPPMIFPDQAKAMNYICMRNIT